MDRTFRDVKAVRQEAKNVYDEKRKDRLNEWKEQVKAYMEKQEWKANCKSWTVAQY